MVVDIDVFALENEYEMTTAEDVGVVALVDIGATTHEHQHLESWLHDVSARYRHWWQSLH